MKRTLIAALVLVLLGIAGLAYYHAMEQRDIAKYQAPGAEPPGDGVIGKANTSTDRFDVTITYTDNGFSPRDITIAQGTRVRFLNASHEAVWPASGVHPTHTLYPEKEASDCLGSAFDACRGLVPGEFYDFTFNYVGTWPFHDHVHAYNSGSIIVTASTTSAH